MQDNDWRHGHDGWTGAFFYQDNDADYAAADDGVDENDDYAEADADDDEEADDDDDDDLEANGWHSGVM